MFSNLDAIAEIKPLLAALAEANFRIWDARSAKGIATRWTIEVSVFCFVLIALATANIRQK